MRENSKLFLLIILLLLFPYGTNGRIIDINDSEGLACVIQNIDGIMNIILRVRLLGNQGLDNLAKLYTDSPSNMDDLVKFNTKMGSVKSVFRYIPYDLLKPEIKRMLVETAFPDDKPTEQGWQHKVTYNGKSSGNETLFRIAYWFTGFGFNSNELIKFNKISEGIDKEQILIIPNELLLDIFKHEEEKEVASPESAKEEAVNLDEEDIENATNEQLTSEDDYNKENATGDVATEETVSDIGANKKDDKTSRESCNGKSNGDLVYKKDKDGEYAAYYLKEGEALYTSVVIRFTGQIRHDDVMKAAEEIRQRSGITDVTDISIGYEIKIPFSLLLPEYLPKDNILRVEYEKHKATIEGVKNPVKSRDLSGIHVILDPGHGGSDPGAIGFYNMYEDEYAYDISCRVREILLSETQAEVQMTVTDSRKKNTVKNDKHLQDDKFEFLNTTPPYNLEDKRVGINLRCCLINHIYKKLIDKGVKPEKIVFTSFHFDARYADSRGVMVYIPGASMRKSSFSANGECYKKYNEYSSSSKIRFVSADMVRSEGYSNKFAYALIKSFKKSNVVVNSIKPVRDRIFRGRRILLPAVL
ncbi:N-acetylmuramoyl-L-alanine amidase, partial [bacterium]|nr:N-acetylmuramoyl-L-alanine amidase [bacterium]